MLASQNSLLRCKRRHSAPAALRSRAPCPDQCLWPGKGCLLVFYRGNVYVKWVFALLSLLALPVMAAEPLLYGRYEYIKLPQIGETLKAKMDTGALTASLSARNIQLFERAGEQWVRFQLGSDPAAGKVYERPLARIAKIKTRVEEDDASEAAEAATRPVIELDMCIGEIRQTVEVNLTDRSHFSYPLLIGVKAMHDFNAAVNPMRRFTAGQPDC